MNAGGPSEALKRRATISKLLVSIIYCCRSDTKCHPLEYLYQCERWMPPVSRERKTIHGRLAKGILSNASIYCSQNDLVNANIFDARYSFNWQIQP